MSVIDTFIYLFQADDKGLQSTQKNAEAAIKKTTDTMDKQDVMSQKLATSFKGLVGGVIAATAAFASFSALKGMALEAADSTNELAKQSRELHIGADNLRAWQNANVRAGGSAEGMTATLKSLSERTRDPLGALERVADRFKGLNDRQADKLGQSLGLDAGTIEMMRKGREGLKQQIELQYRQGEVTKEQIEAANKWRIAQADLNAMTEDTKRRVMVVLLPAFTWLTEKMEKVIYWCRENSRFLALLIPVAAVMGLILFRGQIMSLIGAFVKLTVAMLTNPMVLFTVAMVALGVAIAAVVDDLWAWYEGGKSVFGEFLKAHPQFQAFGDMLRQVFKSIGEAWDNLGSNFSTGIKSLVGWWDWLMEKITAGWDKIKGVWETMKSGAAVVGKFFGVGGASDANASATGANAAATAAQSQIVAADSNPLGTMTSNAVSNSTRTATKNTSVQTGPITVTTASTDPNAVSAAIGQGLGAQIKQANDEFDNGVLI